MVTGWQKRQNKLSQLICLNTNFYLDPYSNPSKNRPKKISRRKARELKFCEYVWTHARVVKIYFDSSGSSVQVGSRSKNCQKMTNLNFELSWYFRTWISICRSVTKMCANMCFIHLTPFDPNWWCWVELPNRNQMSGCQKMTVKKSKSAKRAFLGGFSNFWVNLIRRIRILQKVWIWTMFTRDTAPQSWKKSKNVKKRTKSRSLIFLCFWHGKHEFQLGFDDFMIHYRETEP